MPYTSVSVGDYYTKELAFLVAKQMICVSSTSVLTLLLQLLKLLE